MIDSLADDHPIQSEDRAYNSDVHEIGVGLDEQYLTHEYLSAETQAKWTYFLLGCAILLPWNVLVNATSFFLSRLAGSPFYPTFISYMSSVSTVIKLVLQFYCTLTSKQSSPSRRISVSMVAMIVLISSLCFSTFIRGTPSTFFVFALFSATSTAAAAGYLCTAVYAGAALLGTSFLQAVFSGQAAIAVAISVVQVASSVIALWGSSPKYDSMETMRRDDRDDRAEEVSARIFLGVSVIFLCVTFSAYMWLTTLSFYQSATGVLERHRSVGAPDEHTGLVAHDQRGPFTEPSFHIYQVFKKNFVFMFSLAYVFTVTLAVFPVISARVQPVNPAIHPLLFTAVHFLVFNTGDLLGRYSCSFPYLVIWSEKKILTMSLLRTLFIPLFLFCNVNHSVTIPTPPIICSDIIFMIIVLAMGYTNGHVSTLALLASSSLEHNPRLEGCREDVDTAATLGGSCMILGLALGALSSFGVQAMV